MAIRIVFLLFAVVMWATFGMAVAAGTWTGTQWLMLGLAHAACAVVFMHFAWLFTYGYALSMLLVHGAVLLAAPSLATLLVAGLGMLYGLRLLAFVHSRYRDASYVAIRRRGENAGAGMPLPAIVMMWVAVSFLMTFEGMVAWRVGEAGALTGWVIAGALVMGAGLLLETVADQQKQVAKRRDPAAFVDEGLYRRMRHPNYLGEIVFQLGLMLTLPGLVGGWQDAAMVLVAPLYIVVLMVHAAVDADRQQATRLAGEASYAAWRARTGCLWPKGGA